MHKKFISIFATAGLVAALVSAPNFIASAAACKPVKPTGKTVGQIAAGSVNMPIKSFNYPEGGVMEPQATTLAAAMSLRHMPLSSTTGTSVVVWHVNYAGCNNALNVLTSQPAGYKFKVTDELGQTTTYAISKRYKVTKGDYKESWFDLIGQRKLLLATCAGAFKNGHYQDNVVIIATPV